MSQIQIAEVAARDGLQNESTFFDTESKISLIERCSKAGIDKMEVASFVNPKRVPQMADAEAVIAGLSSETLSRSIGLVLNQRGVERAIEAKIPEINFVIVATDTFAKANQASTTAELLQTWLRVSKLARNAGIRSSVTIAASFGCPFEGEVNPDTVLTLVSKVMEGEPDEVGIADTIGSGVPKEVQYLVSKSLQILGSIPLRCHFHNTRNSGLANAYVAANEGAVILDSSLGGIGGCPFAPRATGNIPTEDLVWMLQRSGFTIKADLLKLMESSKWLSQKLGKETPSLLSRAGLFPPES